MGSQCNQTRICQLVEPKEVQKMLVWIWVPKNENALIKLVWEAYLIFIRLHQEPNC